MSTVQTIQNPGERKEIIIKVLRQALAGLILPQGDVLTLSRVEKVGEKIDQNLDAWESDIKERDRWLSTTTEVSEAKVHAVVKAFIRRPRFLVAVIRVLKGVWIPYAGQWIKTSTDGRYYRPGVFVERMAGIWPHSSGNGSFAWGILSQGGARQALNFNLTGSALTIEEAKARADEALANAGVYATFPDDFPEALLDNPF